MKKMKTVFVTGASGLLGANVIENLINKGYFVKGLVRDKQRYLGSKHPHFEICEGDITNSRELTKLIEGCSMVVHCAGMTKQNVLDYQKYCEVNVSGFKNVIDASIILGVEKIVHVGTANVFGYGTINDLGNEEKEMALPFTKSYYSRSKKEAHDLINKFKEQIQIVEVCPTFMIGALGSGLSTGKLVLMGMKRRIVLCPSGGRSFVCVTDVAEGITKALRIGVNGESYLLANENISFYEFFQKMTHHLNHKLFIIRLPNSILMSLGYIGSFLRLLEVKTSLSIENMKTLCVNNYYSNSKAVNQLDIQFMPIENGIEEAINWFRKTV